MLLLLLACGAEPAPADDTGEAFVPTCDLTVNRTLPFDGATDHYQRAAVEFALTGADPDAWVEADFPGTLSFRDDGATVVYTPTEPLAPGSTHAVTLHYCGGTPTITFGVSAYGEPLTVDPVGLAYAIDLDAARWLAPDGGTVFTTLFADQAMLFSVVALEGDRATLRVGLGDADGAQDWCARTFDLLGTMDGPHLAYGPETVQFSAYDSLVTGYDVSVAATLAADGASLAGGEIRGLVDLRTLLPILGEGGTVDDLCELIGQIGGACIACPDGEDACMDLHVDHVGGSAVPGPLEVVEADDPRCVEG